MTPARLRILPLVAATLCARSAHAVELSPGLAADVRADLARERVAAGRLLWGWAAVFGGSVAYLAAARAGGGGRVTLESAAWISAAAGAVGVTRAWLRRAEVLELAERLDRRPPPRPGWADVDEETARRIGLDLDRRLRRARAASRSALRAGCVVPALLGGIGLYGLAAEGGDVLAGVALSGAMAVGGPSVLTYVGLRGRLARLEDLMARWRAAGLDARIPGEEHSGER